VSILVLAFSRVVQAALFWFSAGFLGKCGELSPALVAAAGLSSSQRSGVDREVPTADAVSLNAASSGPGSVGPR
jgi:hypothetical protein